MTNLMQHMNFVKQYVITIITKHEIYHLDKMTANYHIILLCHFVNLFISFAA